MTGIVKTIDYQVQRVQDRNLLREFFSRNRGLHVYMLGDLEDAMWNISEFTGAFNEQTLEGVLLIWRGAQTPVCLVTGSPDAADILLQQAQIPAKIWAIVPGDLFPTFEKYYTPEESGKLWRMVVTSTEFVDGPSNPYLRRLSGTDAEAVTRLESMERGAFGRDTTYTPAMLDNGIFYGITDKEGHIISVAGTHVVAAKEHVGAVGHVYTAASERGHGYATTTTAAVTRELFRLGISLVALNVFQTNTPAIRAYNKLGYRIHAPINECVAIKR
ncbi:MAG: GNAT family N-acetyltransferase [Chloroflexi bacterium]|nr:GNAT family N-acetyltransferase [Chloroflexota bacterium]